MPDEKTPTQQRKENERLSQEADEADEEARRAARTLDTPAEYDPNSEASKQREPLGRVVGDGWYHDASHSADAARLAAQRARDEEFGMDKPAASKDKK